MPCVNSEVGRLRRVLVREPGTAVDSTAPGRKEECRFESRIVARARQAALPRPSLEAGRGLV